MGLDKWNKPAVKGPIERVSASVRGSWGLVAA
ncbi:hypothetical protein L914_07854 [Phytophthora nicotianae]|uniref:Uncharacterized protein n=1 Tax=Phytophthora nicotianae TaxID=4792 RepID=W2J3Q4_PHYNI|nr:hypothetical protein L916_07893 [Phytophthora nicotianae]ETM47439.1 hypothetical protein L914_07854 [Phytophthora nicotianae]